MSQNWYEVWADEGLTVPYLLLLRPVADGYEILDPAEKNRKVFEAKTYQDAVNWLCEDEFVRVGRKDNDEF